MKKFICIILFSSIFSCSVDDSSYSETIIENKTNLDVDILPYRNNKIDSGFVKKIGRNNSSVVFTSSSMGKSGGSSFGTVLQPYDSIQLIFSDNKKITHVRFNSLIKDTVRHEVFTSPRNITNESNYKYEIIEEKKHSIRTQYKFIITEEHYH